MVWMCLESEKLILPEELIIPENPTPYQQKMRDLQSAAYGPQSVYCHNQPALDVTRKGQSPQNFQDQFTLIRQVCDQLGLSIGQMGHGAKAILKRKRVTNP